MVLTVVVGFSIECACGENMHPGSAPNWQCSYCGATSGSRFDQVWLHPSCWKRDRMPKPWWSQKTGTVC